METAERNLRRTRVGLVVSDKMDKTCVVAIERTLRDRLYGKTARRTTRVKAHDEANDCKVGDKVKLMETRPLSKEKRWRVVEVLERAK